MRKKSLPNGSTGIGHEFLDQGLLVVGRSVVLVCHFDLVVRSDHLVRIVVALREPVGDAVGEIVLNGDDVDFGHHRVVRAELFCGLYAVVGARDRGAYGGAPPTNKATIASASAGILFSFFRCNGNRRQFAIVCTATFGCIHI